MTGSIDDKTALADEEERRATNLELFLDLAFVFAVAQVTVVISSDLSWRGAGRGLLLAWLVWWLWTQFTWMGTVVNLDIDRRGRAAVMISIPSALVMAATVPEALGDNGAAFGVAYFAAQVVAIGVMGATMSTTEEGRRTFIGYAAAGSVGPLLVVIGSMLPRDTRLAIWAGAAAFGIIGALMSGRGIDQPDRAAWSISPSHFSERHALVVIIVLGELLIAAGAASGAAGITIGVIAALVVVASLACVLWWIYFAYIPEVTERALREQAPSSRGPMARDLFSFGHFPMVFGVILIAVVGKSVVKHPADPLDLSYRTTLVTAVALLVCGFMWLHFRYKRGVAIERPVTIVVMAAVVFSIGPQVSGTLTLALTAVTLLVMHAITVHRVSRRMLPGSPGASARTSTSSPT